MSDTALAIEQDAELDDDGNIGGWLNVFWAAGHNLDPEAFIRGVVDRCLEYHGAIPAIHADDTPAEVWQTNVERQDSVEFHRTPEPGSPRSRSFPVTVLDLERNRRGATKCSIDKCREPWATGPAAQVAVEPTDGTDYMAVRFWLCREHAKRFPEPSYRVCLIPVGATIVLEAKVPADA